RRAIDERPRRVVDDDNVGVLGNRGEGVGHRVLPPRAALDDAHAAVGPHQIPRRIGRVRLGQRHHDQPNRLATRQGFHRSIEHGAPTQLEELLGNGRAETCPLAAGGDDGSNAHEMNDRNYMTARPVATAPPNSTNRAVVRSSAWDSKAWSRPAGAKMTHSTSRVSPVTIVRAESEVGLPNGPPASASVIRPATC